MELMIRFIVDILSAIILSIIASYIYDKIKNHSSSANRKSGFELNVKIKFSKK
ncbi:MAG: hypothetical protein RR712_02560 [Terrisporobacter sp.]|uniref:hypothetical protein n=1 Tax=Terrisporobacter sp. TaxID=1965305 RepID=UPI002FCA3C4F